MEATDSRGGADLSIIFIAAYSLKLRLRAIRTLPEMLAGFSLVDGGRDRLGVGIEEEYEGASIKSGWG
jgi:hypothetical protein